MQGNEKGNLFPGQKEKSRAGRPAEAELNLDICCGSGADSGGEGGTGAVEKEGLNY